jgi:hypothetical protein
VLLVFTAVLGLTAGPAFVHVPSESAARAGTAALAPGAALSGLPGSEAISAAVSDGGGLLAVVALVALTACALRRRRAATVALAVVLMVATFEMALHATHHAGDAAGEAKCMAAQAARHAAEADVTALVSAPVVAVAWPLSAGAAVVIAPTKLVASVDSRAPPILTS